MRSNNGGRAELGSRYKEIDKALSPRLKSIDVLRGAAALAVVVHHALEQYDEPKAAPMWFHVVRTILYQGYLGVPLFFVISGFCIHLRCARSLACGGTPALGFMPFWKRRIHRLYPPYFFALCISMGIVLAAYWLNVQSATVNEYPQPRGRWIGTDFLAHVTMLHGLFPKFDQAGGNASFWTLAREEYLYLLYFFVFAWRKRSGIYAAVGLVLATGLAFYCVSEALVARSSEWREVLFSSALVLWIQWCLGMLAVEGYYGAVKLPGWTSELWVAALAGVAAKLAELRFGLLSPALWGFTFFVVVNYCVKKESEGALPRARVTRWLARVGLFSYSLYLIHLPVQRLASKFVRSPLSVPEYVLFCLVLVIASYYSGKVFFHLVESRFLNTGSIAPVKRSCAIEL